MEEDIESENGWIRVAFKDALVTKVERRHGPASQPRLTKQI